MTEGTQCCFILFYFIKTEKKQGLRISCIFAIRRNENNRKKFASTFNVTLNVTQDRNIWMRSFSKWILFFSISASSSILCSRQRCRDKNSSSVTGRHWAVVRRASPRLPVAAHSPRDSWVSAAGSRVVARVSLKPDVRWRQICATDHCNAITNQPVRYPSNDDIQTWNKTDRRAPSFLHSSVLIIGIVRPRENWCWYTQNFCNCTTSKPFRLGSRYTFEVRFCQLY